MSILLKSFLVVAVAIAITLIYKYFEEPKVPTLEDKWWGKAPESKKASAITSTKIDISDEVIKDLYNRLNNTKPFHPSLDGVNQFYGTHTTVLNNVLDYWKTKYNWKERQKYLNKFPHYFVNIRGLRIHFLRIKPENAVKKDGKTIKVLPLLMVHGWPDSIREFYEIIPKLTQPRKDFVFELIIPSLPGFGFSEATTKPGLSGVYMMQIFADLMEILGFQQYYVQGGDWGSSIVQHLAVYFPERVKGLYSNMCFSSTLLSRFKFIIGKYLPGLIYEKDEMKFHNSTGNSLTFLMEESGYFHLQSTKPDTVGVALRDSPMGLAAYILEKFITLTQADFRSLEDGALTRKFTMDQLLDNIMIYWVTSSMTSAMRIYAETFTNFHLEFQSFSGMKIHVPAGCARFPHEIMIAPRSILSHRFKNLIHLSQFDRGGHFAALEEPELLANDIFLFVEKVEAL